MAHIISTVVARSKLKPRREPYWHKLDKGFYLGVRKLAADSDGTWVVRITSDDNLRDTYKSIGSFSDVAAAERFAKAQKAALEIMEHLGRGGTTDSMTVTDACTAFVEHLRTKGKEAAAQDTEKRFKRYVLNDAKLADTELTKLTPKLIQNWRRALSRIPTKSGGNRGGLRSADTLNRDIAPFRAALNLALESGWVTTNFAWKSALKPIEDAAKRRGLYLDRAQRAALIAAAPADLAALLRAMATLPLRPGALAKLTVAAFDARLSTLQVVDKTGTRTITLPPVTAALFKQAAKDKLPGAPLFTRADGVAWNKDSWKYPLKDAAKAAGLPAETTAYTLRHATITDLVHGGLDLLTVAQISGTSVAMIQKHYGHFRQETAQQALAALAI